MSDAGEQARAVINEYRRRLGMGPLDWSDPVQVNHGVTVVAECIAAALTALETANAESWRDWKKLVDDYALANKTLCEQRDTLKAEVERLRGEQRGAPRKVESCDLCEEPIGEKWEWVDEGWSLACASCLAKIRAATSAEAVKALVDALAFYADPATYFAIGFLPDPPCGDFMDDFDATELGEKPGKAARAALAAYDRAQAQKDQG